VPTNALASNADGTDAESGLDSLARDASVLESVTKIDLSTTGVSATSACSTERFSGCWSVPVGVEHVLKLGVVLSGSENRDCPHPEVTANNARPDARMVQNKITREEQRRESRRSLRVSTESICKPKVDLGFVRMREIIEIEANHVNLNFPFVALEKAPRCGLPKGIRNPLNL